MEARLDCCSRRPASHRHYRPAARSLENALFEPLETLESGLAWGVDFLKQRMFSARVS